MSEAIKAAFKYACDKTDDEECQKWARQDHLAGARALLEWARSHSYEAVSVEACSGKPYGVARSSTVIKLSDLEAYFAEESK